MKLSQANKQLLTDEFTFVINKMELSQTPDQILYYLSGLYGMILRVLNIEYSDELLLTHFILEKIHKDITGRINAIKTGPPIILFHENFAPKLIEYTKELKNVFYNSKQRIEVLNKFVVLAFSISGNGYYLSQKGMINIFSDKKQLKIK